MCLPFCYGFNISATNSVLAQTQNWMDCVTSGNPRAAEMTTALYSDDAVLWGTLSEELRVTKREITDYFKMFTHLPELKVVSYKPFVHFFGKYAINDGYYTWSFLNEITGGTEERKARFTFVFEPYPSGKWMIIDHHSSLVPHAPDSLLHATTVLPP